MGGEGCPNPEKLAAYALGRVSEEDLETIGTHIEACSACQSYLETLDELTDSVVASLRGSVADVAADDSLLDELLAKVELIRAEFGPVPRHQSSDVTLPKQIGQYLLIERLGQGSMGTVYKALHTNLKRSVAVKLLPFHRRQLPDAVSRFKREMEAVGQLDHPNIVRAHDASEVDGQLFLVMEFVDGANMASLVRSGGPLEVPDACEIVRQAAVGLQHAHDNGLIHRDVKPSNLMLAKSGAVKVLDLGLARFQADASSDGEDTASGQIIGSPDYMAPEQVSDPRKADARADVYALGCTLYFLLAGSPPFAAKQYDTLMQKVMAHVREDAIPIQRLRPDLSNEAAAAIDNMMSKNPADRCSMAEVVQRFPPFCEGNDLTRLFTKRRTIPPAIQTELRVPSLSPLREHRPKSLQKSVSPSTASGRKLQLFVFVLLALVVCALWYVFSLVGQSSSTAGSADRSSTAEHRTTQFTDQGDVSRKTEPADGEQIPVAGDYPVMQSMQPTVIGIPPNQKIGFPNAPRIVFDSDSPRFITPKKLDAAVPLNITRLFFCHDDYIPMTGKPEVSKSREVNLWIPVKDGPCAQAVPPTDGKTSDSKRLQPTRPLSDGVYCLHTGVFANSQPHPNFCCPFIVRGYGIPQIEKATVEVLPGKVKLSLVVRNQGLGEFNDGFIVATVQKHEGSRNKFQGRRHLDIEPIPPKAERKIESLWETANWKPGVYHFHGAINNRQLWDANKLAVFDTESFVIGPPSHDPNAESSPTGIPSRRLGASLTADLRYSMDLDRWQIKYFHPQILNLSEFPIDKQWIEPPAAIGAKRLYGVLRFGDSTKLNLLVDLIDQKKSTVRIAFNKDVRLDDKPSRLLISYAYGGIEFTISYPDGKTQPYAIRMYYPFEVAGLIGGNGIHYYRACLREGAIKVDDTEYAIAIIDDDTRGDYSDLDNITVLIGVDKNSVIQQRQRVPALSAFKIGDHFFKVSEIARDGSHITIREAPYGKIHGTVVDRQTQKAIGGAIVLVSPSGLSTTTDEDGRYRLQLPEGEYYLVTIKAAGYLPRHREERFAVAGDKPLNINAQLQPAPGVQKGKIRLGDGDSYHFLARRMYKHGYHGGDFYLVNSPGDPQFWANNAYQQGVVDIGDLGDKPLEQVAPPGRGYKRGGVAALLGHTYVSPAKAGEEGRYVIFRVVAIGDDKSVEIEYYYR